MTSAAIRTALASAALAIASLGLPAAAGAADLPELPSDPLTLSCADLGIPPAACTPETVSKADVLQLILRGPALQAVMAPLMEAQVFGPPGALPPPPAAAEGETAPEPVMPVFDAETYAAMLDAGVSRTVVVSDLGIELDIPVVDCRHAICLPPFLSGGPAFVDWEPVPMPEPKDDLEKSEEAPAAE